MIWLTGCKGMLGTEIARQFAQNAVPFIGTDREVE
jgi:dTDP-4-dehydrorhamnose reductase